MNRLVDKTDTYGKPFRKTLKMAEGQISGIIERL